jgi:hypothetical protein
MLPRVWYFALMGGLALSGSPALAQAQTDEPTAADPSTLAAQATIVRNPGSLCDVPTPAGAFRTAFRAGVSTTMRGCVDMDSTRAIPVLLAVRNTDSTRTVLYALPALADVTVKTAKGDRPAVAVFLRAGRSSGFVTELTGIIEFHLRPRDTIWLLYLMPAPAPGSKLQVKGLVPSAVKMD